MRKVIWTSILVIVLSQGYSTSADQHGINDQIAEFFSLLNKLNETFVDWNTFQNNGGISNNSFVVVNCCSYRNKNISKACELDGYYKSSRRFINTFKIQKCVIVSRNENITLHTFVNCGNDFGKLSNIFGSYIKFFVGKNPNCCNAILTRIGNETVDMTCALNNFRYIPEGFYNSSRYFADAIVRLCGVKYFDDVLQNETQFLQNYATKTQEWRGRHRLPETGRPRIGVPKTGTPKCYFPIQGSPPGGR